MTHTTHLAATLQTIDDALQELQRPIKPNDIVTPALSAHEARSAFVDVARHGLVEFTEGTYDGTGKQESEVVVQRLTSAGRELLAEAEGGPEVGPEAGTEP